MPHFSQGSSRVLKRFFFNGGQPSRRRSKTEALAYRGPENRRARISAPRSLRQYTAEAIETLRDIMRDKKAPPAARSLAANALLDRGYGRPPQTVNASVASRPVREMSDAELLAIAASEPQEVSTQH